MEKSTKTKEFEVLRSIQKSTIVLKMEEGSAQNHKNDKIQMPQKRHYRQRAHANPLSDRSFDLPSHPKRFVLEKAFSQYFQDNPSSDAKIEFLDIGCGYGGLLFNISHIFPDNLMLGMEIRMKVSNFAQKKVESLQCEGTHKNVAFIRTNAMKYLPNFLQKGQLKKLFILFPDPHFKKRKEKWRIVSKNLLDEYAYFLAKDALVYTISDLEMVHKWMVEQFEGHPMFRTVTEEELTDDYIYQNLHTLTDEGKNVLREGGKTYKAIFTRIESF